MASRPIKLYRLWCGRKRYTPWLRDLEELWQTAFEQGLAYRNLNGRGGGLGPLTWIERGTRQYARSRTIPEGPL